MKDPRPNYRRFDPNVFTVQTWTEAFVRRDGFKGITAHLTSRSRVLNNHRLALPQSHRQSEVPKSRSKIQRTLDRLWPD